MSDVKCSNISETYLDFKASLLLADIFAGLVGDISLSAWQDKIELVSLFV